MEADSCEPRRGRGLLWETEHLGPAPSGQGRGSGPVLPAVWPPPSCCSSGPRALCSSSQASAFHPHNACEVCKVQLRMGVWAPSVKCFGGSPRSQLGLGWGGEWEECGGGGGPELQDAGWGQKGMGGAGRRGLKGQGGAEGLVGAGGAAGRADLGVGELVPGLLAVGEDLPEHHAEAPHVALGGELAVEDALGRHPADGQHGAAPHLRGRWVTGGQPPTSTLFPPTEVAPGRTRREALKRSLPSVGKAES